MRKSVVDWIEYLKKNFKTKLEFMDKIYFEFIEIFQRRNLFVHNEGVINNIYFSKVQGLKDDIKIGQKIEITKDYINMSLEIVERVGILFCMEIWQKQEKISTDRQDLLQEYGFNFLLEGKWEVAREMFKLLIEEKNIGNRNKTIGLINYWQCFKHLNEFDAIREEVERQDFSDKSLDFQVCFYALRDEFDSVFRLLPQICPSELSVEHLKIWPIFNTIRETEQYHNFIESIESKKEEVGI